LRTALIESRRLVIWNSSPRAAHLLNTAAKDTSISPSWPKLAQAKATVPSSNATATGTLKARQSGDVSRRECALGFRNRARIFPKCSRPAKRNGPAVLQHRNLWFFVSRTFLIPGKYQIARTTLG
jgi:hypothetical protein